MKLKPIDQQTIVITGASSGIGLVTARMASRRGARLFLIARDSAALQSLADELNAAGGNAAFAVADVGDSDQLETAAQQAIDRFGGFDTWINNAGVSIYGKLEDVSLDDQRRLFDTNFWGTVQGARIAARHLKARGGAIINLGSELSDIAVPLQGVYCASKHAVKGYTDALRMELLAENAPVSVTLIKPAGIDTMFVAHAKNYLDVEPKLPAPVYAPEVVARAILEAAERPQRDIYVGGASRAFSIAGRQAPSTYDALMKRIGARMQLTSKPRETQDDSLYASTAPLQERSGKNGFVLESSAYTRAVHESRATTWLAASGLVGLGIALFAQQARRRPRT
ncbi:SDR family oxidoreductase [Chitinasiproducens palmae]|uniref:Short-chain dehydrogenase n=1 Tax=Chitinasiproducens palmae TaxID=1770053 RepID=A0A1H2PR26_9BURK|nr:SDR family oxidoreductase [Chitinasiproducens palmae]SDV49326.1 Short-chain dehydrogenase [Chitinasiproducens palmae]